MVSVGTVVKGPDNCLEGITCYLVQTSNPEMLEGYLEDINEKKWFKEGENLRWLETFQKKVYGKIVCKEKSFEKLYESLGVITKYSEGELAELWWPIWVADYVKVPRTLAFRPRDDGKKNRQSLLNRAEVVKVVPGYKTDVFARQLCLFYKNLNEEDVRGLDTDHIIRIPTCDLPWNLEFKTRKQNMIKSQKKWIDCVSIHKGVHKLGNDIGFGASVNNPISGLATSVSFPCPESVASMLYDWYCVYAKEAMDFNWHIKVLKKEDIFELLDEVKDSGYYRFLKLLWNTNTVGKDLCRYIQDKLNRRLYYEKLAYKEDHYSMQLSYKGRIKRDIYRTFTCEDKRVLVKMRYHLHFHIFGLQRELLPVFIEPYKSEAYFRESLKRHGLYEKYVGFIKELNDDGKQFKGKLTEYISTL